MESAESKEKEAPQKKSYGRIVLTLENAILPTDKLEADTASQIDGLSREIEMDLRILGCELIQTAGILLKLPQVSRLKSWRTIDSNRLSYTTIFFRLQLPLVKFCSSGSFIPSPLSDTTLK